MSYYNTTKLRPGNMLSEAIQHAESQDRAVLRFFHRNSHRPWAPDHVWEEVFGKGVPLTSVRRSISDLTKYGELEKTSEKVTGIYGKPVHLWRVK